MLDTLLVEGGWLARASFGWLPAAYLRTSPAYYRGVDPVIDHDHGNPPGLLKHSETRPRLPPVLKWVDIQKDLRTAKCVAVADLDVYTQINDQWCYNMCAWESCPSDFCVCDWGGRTDGAGYTPSPATPAGITPAGGELSPNANTPGEDEPCPSNPNILRKSKACPVEPEICPKPPGWCAHAAGKNEPKECGGLLGHFCHDVFGRHGHSGFSPCDDKVRPLWGEVKCEAFKGKPKVQADKPAADMAKAAEGKPKVKADKPAADKAKAAAAEEPAASEIDEVRQGEGRQAADAALRKAMEVRELEGLMEAIHDNHGAASLEVLNEARTLRDELREEKLTTTGQKVDTSECQEWCIQQSVLWPGQHARDKFCSNADCQSCKFCSQSKLDEAEE